MYARNLSALAFATDGKASHKNCYLELKVDHTLEEAIAQIKEKEYALRFKGKMAERERYTGRILAVGISYDKETKEHACKIEVL